jgi:hypothetical protein
MPIRAKCSGCQTVVGAPDAAAGKKVKCPKCAGLIAVPAAAVSDFEVVDDAAPPPPAKPAVARAIPAKPAKPKAEFEVVDDEEIDDKPAKKKGKPKKPVVVEDDDEEEDDDDDDRPRKKKSAKAGGPPWLLIRLGILIFIGAILIGGVYLWKFGGSSNSSTGSAGNTAAGGREGPKFVELNDPAGGFFVLVPTEPVKDPGSVPGLQGNAWKSVTTDGKTTVKVGSFNLPPGIFPMDRAVDPAAALAQMDPRAIDAKGYTKVKQEQKLIGGKMGVLVVLAPNTPAGTPGRQHVVTGIVFDEKGKLYGIEITGAEAADDQLINTVFNSFRIL